jgi:hypothetical protein
VTPLAKIAAVVAVLTAVPAVAAADSQAAKRRVPQNFVGATWDGPIRSAPDATQRRQFPKMAAAGTETMRVAFHWSSAQPERDAPFDLSESDRLVELASARRIQVFPHIIVAPTWNRWDLSEEPLAPPSEPELLRPYMKALIERYGPRGSFWDEHPELPRLPIRHWQFWNEPHLPYQWTIPDDVGWAESYAWELRYFHQGVKENDPGAKVVLGGLTNASWIFLDELYEHDIKAYFDVAAVHPYTQRASGVVEIVRRFRRVMKRHGDAGKELFVTELGLPASRGRSKSSNKLQTTPRGMARFLSDSYAALARARRRRATRVSRVYWYTWASRYRGDIFTYTGLFRYRRGEPKPAKRPAFRAFVRSSRELEGCRKSASGRCRR